VAPTLDVAGTRAEGARAPDTYMNPYLAGVGLGLVLLLAFVTMGRGLGASGAFTAVIAWGLNGLAPEHAMANDFLNRYLGDGSTHPLKTWLVFEVAGLFAGALASGLLAGRVQGTVEKGPGASTRARLLAAFLGGALVAVGAALARGCTSGQALTGGALLNAGSWAFMLSVFAGGYAVAWVVRGQWR
jgi:uncharacterized protein